MAALIADSPRVREHRLDEKPNELLVAAASKIYEGSFVGRSSGYARALVANDSFGGLCTEFVDNSAGAAGDKRVKVVTDTIIEANVTGVAAVTDEEATVYASSDNDLTLTSSGNTPVGKIFRWISGTRCMVHLQAARVRSI